MSLERKRSSMNAFQSASKKQSKYGVGDDDEGNYRRASGHTADKPKSPYQSKRAQDMMRMPKEPAGPQIAQDASKERTKQINVLDGEYQLLEIIGEGSFGHVYEAKSNRTGKTVAVKKFKNKYQNKKKAFDQREIQILQKFEDRDLRGQQSRGRMAINPNATPVSGHCPFIMKADRIQLENRRLYIVFERMDMSLTQWIKKKGRKRKVKLSEDTEIRVIMKQILTGLQYMHDDLGIMHRDLKPDNIMINENPLIAKIIDFGTCKDLTIESGPHTSYVSTRWYRAPECVLRSHHYNFVSDVFAAGCIMGELYLQQPLFPGSSELDQIDKILRILGTPTKENWREGYKLADKKEMRFQNYIAKPLGKYLPSISDDALEVISQMLRISAHNRATAAQVLQLPFFHSPVFTPSSQDSHFIKSANMSQSPPNNMNNYLKQSSILTKNQASESDSRIQRRAHFGDGVLSTQREKHEQSLNFSTNHRQLYNNTDSAERGPILTNEESGFYSAKKPKDYYPKIAESKDLYLEHHQYNFPINRKHNKGSTSLVGANNNFSSRDSSTGTASNIQQQTTRPNIRAGYDSQVRGQFSQLPQITQARGTIYKNNYNKNNSSSNTNSGGAFVNTNSSLSPKQMDQTNSQLSQGAASTELGRTKLVNNNLTNQKMSQYNQQSLLHSTKSTAPAGIRQNFNDAFDAIAVHDNQQKHQFFQRPNNQEHQSSGVNSMQEQMSFMAVRSTDNSNANNRLPQSMIAPYKSSEFDSVLSPSQMEQKRTTFYRKHQYNQPNATRNLLQLGSSPLDRSQNANVNLMKVNSEAHGPNANVPSHHQSNTSFRSPQQQQNNRDEISPRMKVSLVQNAPPAGQKSKVFDPMHHQRENNNQSQQYVYKQHQNKQAQQHYNFSNHRGSFMDQREHQQQHLSSSLNQSPANRRRHLRQYKNDEQQQMQSHSYGNFLSSERLQQQQQPPVTTHAYNSPKVTNISQSSFHSNMQNPPFFSYVEPQKPGRNYNHIQINPNFDTNNHIQKTYVSPVRRSPDARQVMVGSAYPKMPKHQSFIPNEPKNPGPSAKVANVRSSYNYKQGGGPGGHMSLLHPKEKDFGPMGAIDQINYRSPPPMKQYFAKDESMEEIDMTLVGGDPADVHSYSHEDAFGHSGIGPGGGYGPSVASSVFVSETIGPGMKAQKSAYNVNNHRQSKQM